MAGTGRPERMVHEVRTQGNGDCWDRCPRGRRHHDGKCLQRRSGLCPIDSDFQAEVVVKAASAAVRLVAASILLVNGLVNSLYVWGRIWLPAVGLEAPSWETWLWSVLSPLLVGAAFAAVAGALIGKVRR